MRKNMTKQTPLRILIAAVMTAAINASWAGGADDPVLTMVQVDRLEFRNGEDGNFGFLEGQGWVGQDLDKLWFKTEAERADGETEEAELQALYSRAVAPNWDLQLGLRKDFRPEPSRNWAVIGAQGLAPYFFEINTALFIGENGRTAVRLEAEYELLLTQRLILTPQVEANFYGQNDRDLGVGSGLSDMEAGLRLRYEIRREFAPYIGVNWNKSFGNTADFARAEGESSDDFQWVIGLRAWF
jgi:copper resistance protein B